MLPRIKSDWDSGNISLTAKDPSMEDMLYMRAFVAFVLISFVEISQNPEYSDSFFCMGPGTCDIKIDGFDVKFNIGGGMGYMYIDDRLPLGRFNYHTIEFENPEQDSNPDPFGFRRANAVEHAGQNDPVRMSIGPVTHKEVIKSHYKSTGVEHHAYKNGHPINSTNKGYKKVPDKTVTRISVHSMPNDMLVQTLKFAEMVRDLAEKNDAVVEKLKSV